MCSLFDLTCRGVIVVAALAGSACSADTQSDVDLPPGWEGAKRVTNLTQADCTGSPLDGTDARVTFLPGAGRLFVQYERAHFRCEQPVEGFYKSSAVSLDVLVQPVEMHPSAIVKCDCLYDITITVEPVAAGSRSVTLFRRWDDWNDPNNPLQIASEAVTFE